jgi:chitin synthase
VYSFFLPVYSFWCMDEFGWGNTRLVIGEGKEKKVIINEDEKFDDSMIPLKKFSGKFIESVIHSLLINVPSRIRS